MGSVHSYESAAGRRYRVAYRKPDRSQGQKRGFTTKRDAELFLAQVEVSKARGEFIDANAARATIGQLGAEWLATQTHLKPSSLRPVEIAWRVHVEPVWGDRGIGSVRHSEVQAWVSKLGTRKSATTVLRAYGVLAGILDVAVKDRRLASNPARGVNLPRKGKRARVYLTHDQVERLAAASGEHATIVHTLAYTGLRWGEVTALRVRHVDALRQRLQVAENAVAVGREIHVGTPKSHEERSVPFPPFLAEPIARACEGKERDELVFAGPYGEHLRRPNTSENTTSWFLRALTAAGLERMTIHDLRHTAASLAISAGANVKAVQRMLGHASAAMTLDVYADLFDDDLTAVSTALDEARTAAIVAKPLSREATRGGEVVELPRKSGGVVVKS
ncbi:site-specific integrase [Agromyces tardus]|uniref:Site-specific integrase n=1 Tax=Agromyces tardus TaxID=2583849 RepID=A0A3M8A8B3_9MICO|nr:site-specific integrase [Agromyces tardus]RNB47398.1 site-specific integrase [Agromyces tardus]